jgi:hypothetical protein
MDSENIESALTDNKVTRRWLLRRTANLTAGLVAVRTINVETHPAETKLAKTTIAPDHDPVTGEIVDRDRHHHWDTV